MKKALALLAVILFGQAATAFSAPIMYVHDSNGTLATVDVVTGDVNVIGNMGAVMTDIAFDPSGNLFGITFTDLYSINRTTGASTLIGSHGIAGGNALVFGTDGTLYGAGANSTSLYTLNQSTGATTTLGTTGFSSGGDLAFFNGNLYLADSQSRLIQLDLTTLSNSTLVGSFGISSVFGLATGDNNVLYGVGGTQIFTINPATGAGTNPIDYGGHGLGQAFGQSFVTEAGAPPPTVPEPTSLLLLGTGLVSLVRYGRRPR